jgi:hypothetical protein
MLKTNVIGIDLAKNVLQICHISKHGELLSNKAVSRQKLKETLAKAHLGGERDREGLNVLVKSSNMKVGTLKHYVPSVR